MADNEEVDGGGDAAEGEDIAAVGLGEVAAAINGGLEEALPLSAERDGVLVEAAAGHQLGSRTVPHFLALFFLIRIFFRGERREGFMFCQIVSGEREDEGWDFSCVQLTEEEGE